MTTLREAATQALGALEGGADSWQLVGPAIDALKEALVEDAMQKFTDVNQELEAALAEPVQEPLCNPHPKAPHGFLRNASHTEDRYVCECEYWDPYEAGYQAGCEAMLRQEDREPAALLTTWVSETEAVTEPLFKAPRRLTDAEIGEVWFAARIPGLNETDARRLIRAAEARSGAR